MSSEQFYFLFIFFSFGCSEKTQFLILNYFFQTLFHVTDTPPNLSNPPAPSSTPITLLLLYFTLSLPYLTQSMRLALKPYWSLCSIYVACGIPCCASGDQVPPNPLPKGVHGIPRGNECPRHMPPLTYLAHLQSV